MSHFMVVPLRRYYANNHMVLRMTRVANIWVLTAICFLAFGSAHSRGRDTLHDVVTCAPFQHAWKGATERGRLATYMVDSTWFQAWVESLASANPDTAGPWPRRAFWVQAWMTCMVQVAHKRTGYRTVVFDSVMFRSDTFVIASERYTLEQVGKRVVAEFGTAAAMFLLGVGSTSGPPLVTVAPTAWTVERILREQARKVVRNERWVFWDPARDVLQLARFMECWSGVMRQEAGDELAFLLPYMDDATAASVALRRKHVQIHYSDRLDRWMRRR